MRFLAYIFFFLLILAPTQSQAGLWDYFKSSTKVHDEKSECGIQIETFKKFLRDGRICKRDEDCVEMDGDCPLGCKFYINRFFVQIMTTEMEKVNEACEGSVCSYKCDKVKSEEPQCFRNKCQAKKKVKKK